MAIVTTLDNGEFYDWLKRSDNYKNNFSYEGANALQEYLEDLSDDLGENIEFDPIAWCCEFSEYEDFDESQNDTDYTDKNGIEHKGYENINSLDDLKDNTVVIEFDGGIIIQDF